MALSVDECEFRDGEIFLGLSPEIRKIYRITGAPWRSAVGGTVATVQPDQNMREKFSAHSFGAVFAEVSVDLGLVCHACAASWLFSM